jgi:Domain of unknown function (DUF4386)
VLNDYAGSVGEVLGVRLFAGLWLAIVSVQILQTRVLPRWLGFLGLVSASLLGVQLARLFGVILGAETSGAKVVYGDNLYMYGKVSGLITPDLPDRATGKKGLVRSKLAAQLMAAHRSGQIQARLVEHLISLALES